MTMDELLKYLVAQGGSDLHLLAGLPPAIRINGSLHPIPSAERFTPDSVRELIYSVLSPEHIKAFETDPLTRNELDFAHSIPGVGRFRFNVHKQRSSVAAVIRALSFDIPRLDTLGLPDAVEKLTHHAKGLVLVTGPTGSGKSTTLASMIDLINSTRNLHIITIEDPIEYLHKSKKSYVTQREVGELDDTLSFSNALKYALRQDPDVILVGELRDYETMGTAVTSAETGHLVFGTLHTPSAAQTIGRIIDVFPADQQPQIITQLASNLLGVISQVLLPTADGKGRTVAVEIMIANTAIRNHIRTNNVDGTYQSIQTGSKEGMITMDQSLINLVREGRITYEVANPHIRDDVTRRQLEQFKAPEAEPEPSPPAIKAIGENVDMVPNAVTGRIAKMQELPPWESDAAATG